MIAIKIKFSPEIDVENTDHIEQLSKFAFWDMDTPFITADGYGYFIYGDTYSLESIFENIFEMGMGYDHFGQNLKFVPFMFEGVVELSYDEFPNNLIEQSKQKIHNMCYQEIIVMDQLPEMLLPASATPKQKYCHLLEYWDSMMIDPNEELPDPEEWKIRLDPQTWMATHQ